MAVEGRPGSCNGADWGCCRGWQPLPPGPYGAYIWAWGCSTGMAHACKRQAGCGRQAAEARAPVCTVWRGWLPGCGRPWGVEEHTAKRLVGMVPA